MKRSYLAIALIGLSLVSLGAQAMGFDVAGFVSAHPDVFGGLALLGFAGETAVVNPAEIKAALEKIGDQVKEVGEKALSEAKKVGDMSADTKGKVDEILVKQGELQARLQEAKQKLDRRAGGAEEDGKKSVGHQVTDSKEFKEYVEAGDYRKGFTFPIKAVVSITSDPASAGDTLAPDRRSGIVAGDKPSSSN